MRTENFASRKGPKKRKSTLKEAAVQFSTVPIPLGRNFFAEKSRKLLYFE
jgi:hypothetical protein